MLNVGEKVPDFCLPNQDEEEICFRDIKGRWIVLYFYPKDNTPGCTTEACDFTAALPDFEGLDAIVLGVSPDSPKKHRNFIEKKDLGITLLADEEKELCQTFGVWQLKKNYGREYMGVVRSTFIIDPDGKVAAKWEKVKVKGHVDEVKAKLEELQTA
ncbi:thioredoxin-dependent thiol peroxidase [Sulfurovum sp. NBC37-1]|uniref:thioredoxin-dependent thiol peroxidase n=1 Tax=Sulfurovum sp. (strain NBC37-1) TaxID=387093 RepID=UPI00015876B4|nr:thioredoxin-dependent thiol peroxidase [Sulfurovum sp. NBC37-1]BAF71273.1 peroxiredoxin family protein [Sulfurovum sp. NBC37-1]